MSLDRPIARPIAADIAQPMTGRAVGGLLLDTYPGAAAAYSLRKLRSGYTGPVVRVRRSSDNTEQDFTASEVGDGTLTSFCGAGDGFVTTWYGQSGNARDATQNTEADQPQIVNSGGLIMTNGEPAIEGNGSSELTNSYNLSFPLTTAYVSSPTNDGCIVGKRNGSSGSHFEYQREKTIRFDSGLKNQAYTTTEPLLGVGVEASSENGMIVNNDTKYNNVSNLSTLPDGGIGIFDRNDSTTTNPLNGTILEIVLWPNNLNRQNVSDEINSYYGYY